MEGKELLEKIETFKNSEYEQYVDNHIRFGYGTEYASDLNEENIKKNSENMNTF